MTRSRQVSWTMEGSTCGPGPTLPADVASWLAGEIGPFAVLADVSWPRASSRVWRLQAARRIVFVKISPDDDSFRREQHALSTDVPRSRIDAPTLIAAEPALRTLVLSEVVGRVVRALTPPLAPAVERDVHRRAGAALASLHRQLPAEERGLPARRLDRLLSLAIERTAMAASVLDRSHREALERARLAMADSAPRCATALVHGDFQPRNWLWSREAQRLAVIDFEAVTPGFWVEDLAWLYASTWSTRPDLRDALLEGYGRGLAPRDETFLAAFTTVGSLEHVAAGVVLGAPVKVANGLRGLEVGRDALTRLRA